MTGQEKKEKCIELLRKWESNTDNKKEHKMTENAIIALCEPIIKKHYEVASEYGMNEYIYGDSNNLPEWENNYSPYYPFVSVVEEELTGIVLQYNPGCKASHFTIKIPFDWFNDEDYDYESYRRYCKLAALEKYKGRIEKARKYLDECIEEYKRIETLP